MISEQQLHAVGLGEVEAKIYHALLHRGNLGLQTLARATGLRRTTLYPYVEGLLAKGLLVTTQKGKRVVYGARSPEGLLLEMNQQRYLLEAMLPQISQILQTTTGEHPFTLYASVEELKAGIERMLLSEQEKGELLTIEGDLENMFRFGLSFWKNLLAQKKKKAIRSRSLIADTEKSEFILHEHPLELRVSSLLRGLSMCVYIRGEEALLFVPSQGTGIHILNKPIAAGLSLLFEGMWSKARKSAIT